MSDVPFLSMSSLQKKTILRRFVGDVLHAYLPASGFVQENHIHYLNLEGRVTTVALREVKTVCFVRDFNLSDAVNPERLLRRTFVARPRGEGLWIRITFRDDPDVLEGLAATDDALLDGLTTDAGLYLSPPDTRANTQRIYVPRLAIASLQILSVINSSSKRQIVNQTPAKDIHREVGSSVIQDALFEGAPDVTPSRGKHGRS